MSRRKSRILALQALYSYDVGGVPVDELLKFEWDSFETLPSESEGSASQSVQDADSDTYDFARILVSGTVNHLEEVDSIIENHLSSGWTMERMNRVSLAILRLSVYSLLYFEDMPATIVIDEAIDLAKDFGIDDSFKFINAVLDTIRKERGL